MLDRLSRYRWPSRSLRHIRRVGRPPEGETPDSASNARTAAGVMAVAALLLAVFASNELRLFARDLPANNFTDRIVYLTDDWHELMIELGPARVRGHVREAFDALREVKWPGRD